jgi:hypothetical protein
MKLRFEVDQAESFRRGINRPKAIVSIDVNPAEIPDGVRSLIANHLVGIDALQFFYHNGEVLKGYRRKELSYTSREPERIVAKAANMDALLQAIKANDSLINQIKESFNRPVQLQLIERAPKNEADFVLISEQRPAQLQEVCEAMRQKRRICFECSLHEIQTSLNQALHANSYVVYLLPLPPSTTKGRFYCEPLFTADFLGRPVVAHSPIVVINEKNGRIVETNSLFQALDVYLLSCIRPGTPRHDISILTWEGNKWTSLAPEELLLRQRSTSVDHVISPPVGTVLKVAQGRPAPKLPLTRKPTRRNRNPNIGVADGQ